MFKTVRIRKGDIRRIRVAKNPEAALVGGVTLNIIDQDGFASGSPLIGGKLEGDEAHALLAALVDAMGYTDALLEAAEFVKEFGADDKDDEVKSCDILRRKLLRIAGDPRF